VERGGAGAAAEGGPPEGEGRDSRLVRLHDRERPPRAAAASRALRSSVPRSRFFARSSSRRSTASRSRAPC